MHESTLYNTLITVSKKIHTFNCAARKGETEKVMDFLEIMIFKWNEHNVVTYSTLVPGYAREVKLRRYWVFCNHNFQREHSYKLAVQKGVIDKALVFSHYMISKIKHLY